MNTKINKKKYKKTAWFFIAPFLIMFIIFKLYPMIYGITISFFNRNSITRLSDTTFIGLINYLKVIQSKTFWICFYQTMIFSLIYTVVLMSLSLLFAILFNKKFKGRTIIRTCFYIPYVTNMIAIGIVWKYLLNPTKGPINAIFRLINFPYTPQWLSSPTLALPSTALIGAWVALAFNIITFLAALQEIPQTLNEVADLEGASFPQKVKSFIVPLLMPTFFTLLTITIINSFRNYATIVGLTNGGPGISSKVIALQIYDDAFTYMKFSIASAEGVIFTGFIILLNNLIQKVKTKWEI